MPIALAATMRRAAELALLGAMSLILSASIIGEAVTDWRRRMRRIYPGEEWL